MSLITIREQGKTAAGFKAKVAIDKIEYEIPAITEPFSAEQEKELEWYFERWLVYPILEQSRAETIATTIQAYGENLFKQIFRDNKIYSAYEKLRGNLGELRIEIESTDPDFHSLHWEALRDPELPYPLAVRCVMVRSHKQSSAVPAVQLAPAPVINLLLVTARPHEEDDVAYRLISRPLQELIANSNLRVKLDLLRPGTYEALVKHLEAKGTGYYQVIHFDVHGALLTYQQFQQELKTNSYTYQRGYGLNHLKPYAGVKAFLFLEGETKGKAVPVEAQELANLLTGKKIPVCLLNACQSAKQISLNQEQQKEQQPEVFRETSLGSQLMAAGMEMVVAMAYSVTVSAAEVMMRELYQHLFDHGDVAEAIKQSRYELFNLKGRRAYFNTTIDLEDWLLPVVYSRQPVQFQLQDFTTAAEEEEYYQNLASQYRFPEPTYGFVGRDLEILKIEKSLLKQNILLLRGMGGTGKTTLLNYLRQWWQVTNFATTIFYFGYDLKPWTVEQIVWELGEKIFARFDNFHRLVPTAKEEKLLATLKANAYILILDNLESVTGEQLAIPNTLPATERNKLRDFLVRLRTGKTKVILGSRSQEDWLKETTFQDNVYELKGLDGEARTLLAQRILQRNVKVTKKIEQIQQDENFQPLLKLLAGYPLAMEVVLANLKYQSPAEILAKLEVADGSLDTGKEDKTSSILKCVEYSHSNLSEEAQKLLLCLAPFSGFIFQSGISYYTEELKKLEPFKDYPFHQFDSAVEEAINWGLLSPDEENPKLLTIQPVFPYFLQTKVNELPEEMGEALQEGFKNHYVGLANSYNQLMESKEADKRQSGIFSCRLEYENLYHGLVLSLKKQETVDIFFCLFKYLTLINDVAAGLKLAEFVWEAQKAYPEAIRTGEIGLEIVMTLERVATGYLETKNYSQAKEFYQQAIELTRRLKGIEERQKQLFIATTYHQLGIVAEELRQWDEAKNNYQQALSIKIEYNDRYSQARTYHELGIVAQELRQWEEAKNNYQQAIAILIEYNDRYSQAKTYHNLGIVAQELRQWEFAKNNYQQALAIFIEYNDRYSQASTYHQLGMVAQELRQWDEAKNNYQQALAICIEYNDRYYQASTYNQLGTVAQELRQWEFAKNNYQQALAIFIEYNDRYSQAGTYHNLGIVARELRQWEFAKNNYQQALAICIEYNDRYSQATIYHQLGTVAQELRQWEFAKNNYQQALAIFIEYNDRYSQASTYHHLGILAEELEEYSEAKANYLQALEYFAEFNDTYMIETFSIPALARLYLTTQDQNLLTMNNEQ